MVRLSFKTFKTIDYNLEKKRAFSLASRVIRALDTHRGVRSDFAYRRRRNYFNKLPKLEMEVFA